MNASGLSGPRVGAAELRERGTFPGQLCGETKDSQADASSCSGLSPGSSGKAVMARFSAIIMKMKIQRDTFLFGGLPLTDCQTQVQALTNKDGSDKTENNQIPASSVFIKQGRCPSLNSCAIPGGHPGVKCHSSKDQHREVLEEATQPTLTSLPALLLSATSCERG